MKVLAGGPAIAQLHATDLDHAMALADFKAGGFGIQHDLTHDSVLRDVD